MNNLIVNTSASSINQIEKKLGIDEEEIFSKNVDHFSVNEGSRRDKIVEEYFGSDGMKLLIEEIVSNLSDDLVIKENDYLLDLGSGTGTFLLPVANKLGIENIVAFDLTAEMLRLLEDKVDNNQKNTLHSIIGDMENINESIELNIAKRDVALPSTFRFIMSTLAFHHIPDTAKVLEGIKQIMDDNGKAIIVDAILSDTSGMEPTTEHAHDGFDVNKLRHMASEHFSSVNIKTLGVTCTEKNTTTGEKSETSLFMLILEK